jgi:2-polyprenyl-3-methyl-5-hydroxy-6-metoxy-1,4-benzoquinol methylase
MRGVRDDRCSADRDGGALPAGAVRVLRVGVHRQPSLHVEAYDISYRGEAGVLADPAPYVSAAERWVLRRLRATLPPGARVVDIGCGTGRFLRAARRAGFDVVGIVPL